MTLLDYEHHTDTTDVHDVLYRFGVFAASVGWTVHYNLTNCGTWDTGTGTFGAGDATFVMISMTGAVNGNHVAQNLCYQCWSEISGDRGRIRFQGRDSAITRDIGDASVKATHPLEQGRLFLTSGSTAHYRFLCKGTLSPNVWFFGNERLLALQHDNDGVSCSPCHIGTWDAFDKSATNTDITMQFIQNFQGINDPAYEWDTVSTYTPYWTHPGGQSTARWFVVDGVPVYYDIIKSDLFPIWNLTQTFNFVGSSIGNSRFKILGDSTNPEAGYKMSYGSHRILIKPITYKWNSGLAVYQPLGQIDHYYCWAAGLANGAIIENGTRQFMVFRGFNPRDHGVAYRIA